jgi:hypothetical protein
MRLDMRLSWVEMAINFVVTGCAVFATPYVLPSGTGFDRVALYAAAVVTSLALIGLLRVIRRSRGSSQDGR